MFDFNGGKNEGAKLGSILIASRFFQNERLELENDSFILQPQKMVRLDDTTLVPLAFHRTRLKSVGSFSTVSLSPNLVPSTYKKQVCRSGS